MGPVTDDINVTSVASPLPSVVKSSGIRPEQWMWAPYVGIGFVMCTILGISFGRYQKRSQPRLEYREHLKAMHRINPFHSNGPNKVHADKEAHTTANMLLVPPNQERRRLSVFYTHPNVDQILQIAYKEMFLPVRTEPMPLSRSDNHLSTPSPNRSDESCSSFDDPRGIPRLGFTLPEVVPSASAEAAFLSSAMSHIQTKLGVANSMLTAERKKGNRA